MELHPEDSIGGLTAANLPFETTTELTTNVLCRDGQTVLIGGLFREVTTTTRGQVPFLGDIPGIGAAFRNTGDETGREEVIILLTVHLVKDHEAYAQAGRRQLDDIERSRVGLRRGLMWTGRERLAQAHYRKALEHFATGDVDRALWDVRLALHNFPRFLSAIHLREEILQDRAWDDEGSVTRDFMSRLILQELAPGDELPPFGRPDPPFAGPQDLRGPWGFEPGDQGSGT
jgi:type IV pilus assembly protein PilQ